MKQFEAQAQTQMKVEKIKALCEELKISLTAKQVISRDNVIEMAVCFEDREQYEIDKPDFASADSLGAGLLPGRAPLPDRGVHIGAMQEEDKQTKLKQQK